MFDLLTRCLQASYIHTHEGGDFAVEFEDGILYLLFEWSDGHEDWKNNLSFSVKQVYPNESRENTWYCHRGFLKVWQAIRPEILSLTEWYLRRYRITHIICIGYSHGAAIALLATEYVTKLYQDKYAVSGYGFGCPRVVKGHLPITVQHNLAHFTAIRNIPDLVTHLPPSIFGFHHVGLYEIGEKGKYSPISAHRAENYLTELEAKEQPKQNIPVASLHRNYVFGRERQRFNDMYANTHPGRVNV